MKRTLRIGEKLIAVNNKNCPDNKLILGSIHTVIDPNSHAPRSLILTCGPSEQHPDTIPLNWGSYQFISYPDEIDFKGEK